MSKLYEPTMEQIKSTGGATLSLQSGTVQLMGDEYDRDVWLVGGATCKHNAKMPTETIEVDALTEDLFDIMVSVYSYHALTMYQAIGFWKNPEGKIEVDLVDTFTFFEYAMATAELRGERAIINVRTHETVFTGGSK